MKSVLVVDDSPVIRKVARRILDGLRLKTSEADSGEAGLRACEASMPDAIFLDWNMPELDGADFIRRLRRLPNGDAPKVIFCITENDMLAIARAIHAGANDYVLKPFDKQILQKKFEQVGVIQNAA